MDIPGASTGSSADIADFLQFLLPAVAAVAAAFFGAYFAFRFQNQKAQEEKITSQIDAINRTMLVLGQMKPELLQYKNQVIGPYVDKPLRAFSMRPSNMVNWSHLALNSDTLSFLCETDYRQVPMTVGSTNTLFHKAALTINQRTAHHIDVVQPLMAKVAPLGTPLTNELIERGLGVDQKILQESHTDNMILYVQDALKAIEKCVKELEAASKDLYEKGRTVTFQMAQDVKEHDKKAARRKSVTTGDNYNRIMGWSLLVLPPSIALLDSLDGITSVGELIVESVLMVIGGRLIYVNRDRTRKRFLQQISPFHG